MQELRFPVAQDGGWVVAVCHRPEMATQAESLQELVPTVRDLIRCHFDPGGEHRQWPIRLYFGHDPARA